MKTRLTPQQKKQLSLDNDRRNNYGNNDKAARTGVRRKRAHKNRKYRHNVRQAIAKLIDLPDSIDDATTVIRRNEWMRKWRDIPLGEKIKLQRERRARTGQTKR